MSKLEALRMQVRALEGYHFETCLGDQALPFEDARLNAPFRTAALQLGALHEFRGWAGGRTCACGDGLRGNGGGQDFAQAGRVRLWASSRADCYAPGLIRLGLDPSRIVWVDCPKDDEVLSVMEEALHSRALAAVLGEAGALSLKTARRLDAAARQSGATALLLRRPLFKSSKGGLWPERRCGHALAGECRSCIRHPGTGLPG